MNFSQSCNIITLLVLSLGLYGCASAPGDAAEGADPAVLDSIDAAAASDRAAKPAPVAARPKPSDYPVEPFPQDSMYQLLVAEVAGYRGEYEVALEKYVKTAQETRDAGVAARATRLAKYLKKEDMALITAQLWAELEPLSLEAHRHSAELLVRVGNLEQAILHMEAIKNLGGLANFDVFAYRAANLDDAGRTALLTAVTRMLQDYPEDEQLLFAKAVLLEQKGEMDEALAIANQLLLLSDNLNVMILKVNALRSLNRNEDAIDFLGETLGDMEAANAKVSAEDPSRETAKNRDSIKRLRLIYARFLFESEMLDRAKGQYELILETAPNDGDILFALALIAMEQENNAGARDYLGQMIRWNRRVGEARYYLGTIAEKNNEIDLAIKEYKQAGSGYEFLPAQSRIANLLVDQGRIEEMQEYLANVRADNPESANQLVMIEAQIFADRGKESEVFAVLDEAVQASPDSVELLYFRAMTGEGMGRLDILERDLGQIIAQDPNNADALNALGYTLTDQTDRHEEALVLIERALEIKPDEAAFIDSLGWVHYRMENFELAVKHLRRALELFENDEVAAHLGEALWALGEIEEAKEVWRKAQQLAPDSEILLNVIKKFTES